MKKQIASVAALGAAALAAGYFAANSLADRGTGDGADNTGATPPVFQAPDPESMEGGCEPNVQVSRLGLNSSGGSDDWAYYGSGVNTEGMNVRAYSAASTSCNVGCAVAEWIDGNSGRHPVIAQNAYAYNDGRFEQIGMSWLKHSFCAVSEPTCGACQGTSCSTLGVGCADTYWATLNGNWGDLGPRSQINPWPAESNTTPSHTDPHGLPSGSSTSVRGRLQVLVGAENNQFEVFEIHYLTHDEPYEFRYDNASWRYINLNTNGITTTGIPNGQGQDSVHREPAIFAWRAIEPSVSVKRVNPLNDGGFFVGTNVVDNGDGTWEYIYGVFNMNSDRAGGSFTIPFGENVTVSDTYHNMPFYHSGEPSSFNDPWTTTVNDNDVTFATPQTYSENTNSSAIRWSTMHTFSITVDAAPTFGQVQLGLFKPPADESVAVSTQIPGDGEIGTPCTGDTNGDNVVNVQDLVNVVLCWGGTGADCPEPGNNADVNDDEVVNVQDLVDLILAWGDCP